MRVGRRRVDANFGCGVAGRKIDPTRPRVFEYQVSQLARSQARPSDKHLPGQFVSCSCRIEKTMPPPGPDTYIFCCGPPPMIKSAIAKLEALGHDPSHVLCF